MEICGILSKYLEKLEFPAIWSQPHFHQWWSILSGTLLLSCKWFRNYFVSIQQYMYVETELVTAVME